MQALTIMLNLCHVLSRQSKYMGRVKYRGTIDNIVPTRDWKLIT